MLKEQILQIPLSQGVSAIISVLETYPFTMENKDGYPFKPDDVIHLLENNINSAGNLKTDVSNHAMIDNTYGLNQQLSALAKAQGLQVQPVVKQTEKAQALTEGMLFSKRKWRENTVDTEASKEPTLQKPKHAKLIK